MAAAKKPRVNVRTPVGRFSFPYFSSVDSGRQYSDDAYKCDFLITKEEWVKSGAKLKEAVLSVGKEYFGNKFTLDGKWKVPFKDTDKDDRIENEKMKGCVLLRAKSGKRGEKPAVQPMFYGPRKGADGKFPQLTPEEILAIKGGDWGVLDVVAFPYDQQGGGVTLALNAVQFWKPGEAFGQGVGKVLETAEELPEEELEEAKETDII